MSINDPTPRPALLRPRFRTLLNGFDPETEFFAQTIETGHFHAGRLAADFWLPQAGVGSAAWWSGLTPAPQDGGNPPLIDVEIQLGFIPMGAGEGEVGGWTTIMRGAIDKISIELDRSTLHIDGRDYVGVLIDFKLQKAYSNKTSSEIVTDLVDQVNQGTGVKLQVTDAAGKSTITPTTTMVERYYEVDHDALALDNFHRHTTAWDFIVTLARYEGFDAWVAGKTLYFQPPPSQSSDPYVVRWTVDPITKIPASNAKRLSLDRNYTISKGVQVVVKSWNSKQAKGFTASYPGSHSHTAGTGPNPYLLVRPNLTHDQALQLAQMTYRDIVSHERLISVDLIIDALLNSHVLVKLEGTGTDYDQIYFPHEITRRISADSATMHLMAKNQNLPASGVTGL